MDTTLDSRLTRTRRGLFAHEFFTNSAHFPLANIFLEMLLGSTGEYLLEPDLYLLLAAALLQAWWISFQQQRGQMRPLLDNLVGPAFYTLGEIAFEGVSIIGHINHIAYWTFSLVIGLARQLQIATRGRPHVVLVLVEHVVRTCIVLAAYVILELKADDYASAAAFLADAPHAFISIVIPLLGLVLGIANYNIEGYQQRLSATAQQLRQYSEWLLGKELLQRAVANPRSLSLSRQQRAILFMDIRGFTAWSEPREPEEVVDMINRYYESCEEIWHQQQAVKVKLTADEIMLVFADVSQAAQAAAAMRDAITPLLQPQQLSAGCGIHYGPVVEGLIGARERRGYDLLGDSVNTAKRLCDAASGGEILFSAEAWARLKQKPQHQTTRELQAKGKQQPIFVYSVI